ncbi:unnamed protein product [Mytilus edulis]|uniref:Uncharacterized protein n=1 Tax=Mytilus edulis TaxID=6550 RepID=A0A8S3S564_MYTED|nr:unnamed protein product [Mytilus edulis]
MIDRLLNDLEPIVIESSQDPRYAEHPINAFHLIGRFVYKWPVVYSSILCEDCTLDDTASGEEHGTRLLHTKYTPSHLKGLVDFEPSNYLLKKVVNEEHGTGDVPKPANKSSDYDSSSDQETLDFEDCIYLSKINQRFHDAISHIKEQSEVGVSFSGVCIGRDGKLSLVQVATTIDVFVFDVLSLGPNCWDLGLNELEKDSCKPCTEGYYCDNSIEAIGDLTNYTCPLGQYCPGQTEYGNQYPCPSGTFNNRSGMVNETDCQQCTPGYYCQNTGLPEPQGLCFPGYYCNGSTIDPNPSDGLCPVGNYCPEGSYQPTACPDGTIAASTGNDNLTDCQLCKPGNYCTPASSKNGHSLPCDAGFICMTGSNVASPTDGLIGYICPAGHYCLSGAVTETPCDIGTYAPSTGLGACLDCLEGTTCPTMGMNATLPCPSGHYCLNGTYNDGIPCSIGN